MDMDMAMDGYGNLGGRKGICISMEMDRSMHVVWGVGLMIWMGWDSMDAWMVE
jgi:hypothetical protein